MLSTSSKNPRLLRRAEPQPGESLWGYVTRLAELNHYSSSMHVFEAAGVRSDIWSLVRAGFGSTMPEDEERFLQLVDISIQQLDSVRFRPDPDCGLHYFCGPVGARVPRFALRDFRWQFCPKCLAEQPYHRAVWNVALVTTCPSHGCYLIDACPRCAKKLSIGMGSVCRCSCEFELAASPLRRATPEECGFSARVEQLWTGDIPNEGLNSVVETLSLVHLIRLVSFLAGIEVDDQSEASRWRARNRSLEETHRRIAQGYSAVTRWPEGFYELLDRCPAFESDGGGIQQTFGHVYTGVFKEELADPVYNFVRLAFGNYVEEVRKYRARSNCLIARDWQFSSVWTLTETARFLKMRISTVLRHAANGTLTVRTLKSGSRNVYLFERISVEILSDRIQRAYTPRTAARVLGIGRRSVVELVKRGYIEGLTGPSVDGGALWRIGRDSLQVFCSSVSSRLKQQRGSRYISFDDAIRMLSGSGYGLVDLVGWLVAGSLSGIAQKGGPFLARVRLSQKDVLQLAARRRREERRGRLTVNEAAAALGIKPEALYGWVRRGVVGPDEYVQVAHGILFADGFIRSFRSKYFLASHRAWQLGTSAKALVSFLAATGVAPVSGPSVDGSRQYLFLASDVERIAWDACPSSENSSKSGPGRPAHPSLPDCAV